jgi:hypothetical protein
MGCGVFWGGRMWRSFASVGLFFVLFLACEDVFVVSLHLLRGDCMIERGSIA